LRRSLEMLEIGRFPPITQRAFGVERRAFRVEGVADLVANDRTDGAVVSSCRCLRIEEPGLQNGAWEVQRILQRKVYCIDCLRSHRPLVLVHGRTQASDLTLVVGEIAAP